MPRPSLAGPILRVQLYGRWAGWCDGVWQGDPEMVANAKRAALNGAYFRVLGDLLQANDLNLRGRLVALHATDDGRSVITDAPAELIAELREGTPGGEGDA